MKAQNPRARRRPLALIITIVFHIIVLLGLNGGSVCGVQILSKSKLQKCEKVSESDSLNCTRKIILDLAVPSGSSGGEASIVAEIVEVEENSTHKMQTLRVPPMITINKSAAYAVYEITYIRVRERSYCVSPGQDVPYKPEEYFVKTRKCKPDASAKVVKICERLRDENGHIVEHTQPVCCPCGTHRRVPSSCGNFFDKLMKGKANTAHCLRFPGDWFHVFGIGQRSLGFSVHIEVKTGSQNSEVIVGPENRTVTSNDNFLRVNLIGDFAGYTNIPSFEDFYLVIPRGGPGQPQNLGVNFSMWMLLERVRFTLDGLECNKIGVSYEAFNGQPNFCSSPYQNCLYNQLWNFWEADQNRINRHQLPLYGVEGRFERINQHPNAGTRSFSIGITEVLNTNLLIELSADDIEYVYQRSPGKILSVTVPTFEALTQFGTATVTTKNVGEVEASYGLTFDCSSGVTLMEEQFFIMKPNEITSRSFKLYPTTDQAAKYVCSAILKDADYSEADRAECQFITTATVLDNGTQTTPFQPPKTSINGFFESIESIWNKFWDGFIDFITGRTCRFIMSGIATCFEGEAFYNLETKSCSPESVCYCLLQSNPKSGRKCSRFFDFSCHIQYICMSWIVLFGLLLAIFPTVLVLLWLLHQKGLFDPLYDWWEDRFWADNQSIGDTRRHGIDFDNPHSHLKHHKQEVRHYRHDDQSRRRNIRDKHRHKYSLEDSDYYYLHRVHKNKHKQGRSKNSSVTHHVYSDRREDDEIGQHRRRKQKELPYLKMMKHGEENNNEFNKRKQDLLNDTHIKLHTKHRG